MSNSRRSPVKIELFQPSSMREKHIPPNIWYHCWLWKVLLMTGFSREKYQSRAMQLLLKITPFTFLHCRTAFSIFLLSRHKQLTKSSFAAVTMNLCSIFVWYYMNLTEKYFRPLCAVTEKIMLTTSELQYKENRYTNILLVISFLIPLVFSGSMVYAFTREKNSNYANFWLVGSEVHNSENIQLILLFVNGLIYYSVLLNTSILIVTYVSFCNTINSGIQYHMDISKTSRDLIAAIEYNRLIKSSCELLENCYATPISIALIQLSLGIFMAITLLLGFSPNPASVILQETILFIFVCFTFFCLAIITASRIPNSIEKARFRYKILYYKELAKSFFGNRSSKETLSLLKALSEMKIFHLTAGSTLRMNKTLIVSSLGCFLTYGLLLVQMSSLQVTGI